MGNIKIKKKADIEKDRLKSQISKLEKQLTETDYQIIKCYEYQLTGLELPYDIKKLHERRQALRDRINELGGLI